MCPPPAAAELPGMSTRLSLVLATALAVGTVGTVAAEPPPPTCPIKKAAYSANSSRIEQGSLQVEGRPYRYSVLLPSDYSPHRSYPVLYWLHGATGNESSAFVDPMTPGFMEKVTQDQPVIMVFPDGGFIGMYADWNAPGHQWETFHTRLIDHIDATYPTTGKRAIAGFSMGGLGAMSYAARHRGQFAAAASFSGLLDTSYRTPTMKAFLTAAGPVLIPACTDRTASPFGPWGDPVTGASRWEEHNPTALAPQLRGVDVYAATGDGRPCDHADTLVLAQQSPTNPLRALEPVVRDANLTFHGAMLAARVPHTFSVGCGIHSWRYWERELVTWWPKMMQALRTDKPVRQGPPPSAARPPSTR
jgi:S-formylglutathione hydrolase FrmB